jgi:polyisoprenoid-binding protein YceI
MKKIAFIIGLAIVGISTVYAQTINSGKSIVNFSIKNMKVRTVEGTFIGMKGEIRFDETNLANSGFKVTIDAATVNTENEKRDDHLRNEDFFHVEEYPVISFESSSIKNTSEGFITTGMLSMHGVSNEVAFPFTYSENQFRGILDVNRFDYKIGEGTSITSVDEIASLEIIAVLN